MMKPECIGLKVDIIIREYGLSFYVEPSETPFDPFGFVKYASVHKSAPLTILGVHDVNLGGVYYLEYVVSQTGELEIQLSYEDRKEKREYASFPLDFDFGRWDYAISSDGKVAWLNQDGDMIYISDGKSEAPLTEVVSDNEEKIIRLEWKNDETLLYIAYALTDNTTFIETNKRYNYSLKVLDISDEKPEGKDLDFYNCDFDSYTMSVNETGNLLAVFGRKRGEAEKIYILNLDNGEQYVFNPWKDSFSIGESSSRNIGYTERGSVYFEPLNGIQPEIVWCPD